MTFLAANLQLTIPQTVALMGGHTVGRASRSESGYQGVWKGRADTFSTGYYVSLLSLPWHNDVSSFNGKAVNQWSVPRRPGGGGGGGPAPGGGAADAIMLNSDMQVRMRRAYISLHLYPSPLVEMCLY